MISIENNPWSYIQKPEAGYNVKRADADHPHDFFWGKDDAGNYLLLFELTKDLAATHEDKRIDLHGIKTDITYHTTTSEYFFKLSLQSIEDADIFYRLCLDLIDRTKGVLVRKVALEIIHSRLKRWKAFLRGKKKYLLSAREVRGLFAELEFVHKWLTKYGDQLTVLEGWQGPLDEPQDFVLGDFAVEIKSLTGLQKDIVKISSEHQLVTHLDNLFLHVIYLAEFHDCKNGVSLNNQVKVVRNAIKELEHKEVFDSRLYEIGYIDLKDYDSPCYSITKQESFHVREGFPRITPADLNEGVSGVTYDLEVKSLSDYVCELPLNQGVL